MQGPCKGDFNNGQGQFKQQYPKVTLRLQFVQKPQDYINSEFDLIIMWKVNLKPFPDYALITKKLFSMPVGIYASSEYLQQHGTPKTPDGLLCNTIVFHRQAANGLLPFKMAQLNI